MCPTNPDESERKSWPAPTWKAGQHKQAEAPEPPIRRHIALPEKVSVKFLAEISGQTLNEVVTLMSQLRVLVSVNRSVDFDDAAKILRKYGIAAERESYNMKLEAIGCFRFAFVHLRK